jgi:hypothetical protein
MKKPPLIREVKKKRELGQRLVSKEVDARPTLEETAIDQQNPQTLRSDTASSSSPGQESLLNTQLLLMQITTQFSY